MPPVGPVIAIVKVHKMLLQQSGHALNVIFLWVLINELKKLAIHLFHLYTTCYLFEFILFKHELERFPSVAPSSGELYLFMSF